MKFIVQNISVLNSKAKQLILEETFKTYEQRPCLLKENTNVPLSIESLHIKFLDPCGYPVGFIP